MLLNHEFEKCFIGICPSCNQDYLRAIKLRGGGHFIECCNGCTFEQILNNLPIKLSETSFDIFKARKNQASSTGGKND